MPPDPPAKANLTFGVTRKSLEASVIHACPHCEAPGLYRDDQRTRELWPGCFDEKRANRPVGDVCPNCQKSRRPDLGLGELTASMPLWIWNCILAAKWCALKVMSIRA